jgi:hypothetical protein
MSWGHSNLYNAIYTDLAADATLVALVGDQAIGEIHDPEYRIGSDSPTTIQRSPYMGYSIVTSEPLLEDVSSWRRSVVLFRASSTNRALAMKIADYMEDLLDPVCSYYNFSDSNITHSEGRFLRRITPQGELLADDLWKEDILIEMIWAPFPCTGTETEPDVQNCAASTDDDLPYGNNCPDD